MFLPTTTQELKLLGWNAPDVIFVTGDTYIDGPFTGIAILGKLLLKEGYTVGIIAQPDVANESDITRLGEPNLFWGVTAGALDSMIANYTALKKRRKTDDFTPGGINNRRPDRATIIYANLIRRYFKNSKPIVIGGLEASLRRIVHYDYWNNQLRKSILFDSKSDILAYGMCEKTIIEIAHKIKLHQSISSTRGVCYVSQTPVSNYIKLPSFTEVLQSKDVFVKMFNVFYENNEFHTAKGMYQQQDTRYLIHNPPPSNLTKDELDKISELDFERAVHPFYQQQGIVKAMETIKFSIITHRGCYGECSYCSIGVHQGTTVVSRSINSIVKEVEKISIRKDFKGYISDIGGPTANMYEIECPKKVATGKCQNRNCLYPVICLQLPINHQPQIKLLHRLCGIKNLKKAFIASGIRYDMVIEDKKYGVEYIQEIVKHHISGQLRIAPEHSQDKVLQVMCRPNKKYLIEFKTLFDRINQKAGKKQFLSYYLIAAHPMCTIEDMLALKKYAGSQFHILPEDVQIFTPLPSTYSAVMYYTGINPFTNNPIFVEKNLQKKEWQKRIITGNRQQKHNFRKN